MTLSSDCIVNNILSATVKYPQYIQALTYFSSILNFTESYRREQGLLLVGPSGSGKTRLAEAMSAMYASVEEAERTRIRVVHISMPANPTIISVCKLLLEKLGQRYAGNAREADLTNQLKTILKKTGAAMLLIDEAQHLVDGSKIHKTPAMVADWLKQLMNDTHISVTLVGVPSIEKLMLSNSQLRRRFSRKVILNEFCVDSEKGLELYIGLIGKLINESGYDGNSEYILLESSLKMLYYATNGRIGYITALIAEALSLAICNKSKKLTNQHFYTAYKNIIWVGSRDSENPFSGKFTSRHLIQAGEPFYEEQI